MKYAVIYLKSDWTKSLSKDFVDRSNVQQNESNKILLSTVNNTLACLVTMPPYGATLAGNVLRSQVQNDFIGVFDENMLDASIEDTINDLYTNNNYDDFTLFFSVYVFNNERTQKIIEILKKHYSNIFVVIGGPFAEYFQQNVNVDSIIIGDAETGIQEYLKTKDKLIIAEKSNQNEYLVDFSVIQKKHEYEEGVISSMRGCKYRTGIDSGCVFCSLKEITVRLRDPELVLKEMAKEAEDLGTKWFFDGSDSFILSKKWLRKYSTIRSKLILNGYGILEQLKIYAYANPSDIKDKEIVELLYACGIRKVYLGIESSDNVVLANMNKPDACVESNLRALMLLKGSNIEVRFGIVLGFGENEYSLMSTYNFLKGLKNYLNLNVSSIVLSPVLVLPGSKLYQNIIADLNKYNEYDILKINEIDNNLKQGNGITKNEINLLSRIYLENNNSVSYSRLLEWIDKMNDVIISQNIGIWVFDGYKKNIL